jgi:hypothetical protein
MPPVSQGSRVPIYAATVVSSIIAVAMLITAIYFYVDASKSADKLTTREKQFSRVITPGVMTQEAEEISKLEAVKQDPARGLTASMTGFDVLLAQRNNLSKLMNGDTDEAKALVGAKSAIEKAKLAGAKPAGDSMVAVVDALLTQLNAIKADLDSAKANEKASREKLEETVKSTSEAAAKFAAEVVRVQAEQQSAATDWQRDTQQQAKTFSSAAEELRKQLDAANEQINVLNTQNASLAKQVEQLKILVQQFQAQNGEKRVDPNRALTTAVDGKVIRVLGGGNVIIDLGQGDHITKGLTFEVFDRFEGVPPLGDPNSSENMPVGKASIIVDSVTSTGSVCKIIRLSRGVALTEGDLIANLVYDKNTTYNFFVYGNFDLDQNGVATAQDAEVIKRLITQWGGKLSTDINVDTDFVVLGKEPTIPDKPPGDDPIAIANYTKALEEADRYASFSVKAREFRTPTLNQNRFLYMIGYYEQARK